MATDPAPRPGPTAATEPATATSFSPKPGHLQPGALIGRYVIVHELGFGGMGAVYAAFDSQLARRVAIKVVRPEVDTADARARLLGEAQAMARLTHPNVVAIHDVGLFGDAVFIAMEYVDGPTLKQWLREPRTWSEALATLVAAGQGLAAAHAAGLVHRDFKPDNVLIGGDGRVRVSDFGVARAERPSEDRAFARPVTGPHEAEPTVPDLASSRSGGKPPARAESFPSFPSQPSSLEGSLTKTGALVGTVGYMSPERAFEGHDDARSDQFAFCETLYLALYGRHPFKYEDMDSYLQAICRPARPPPADTKVPAWLGAVVLRGLALDPSARFATMRDLLDALARDPRPRRRRIALALAAVGAISLVGLGVTHETRTLERACREDGDAVRAVWSDAARGGVHAAFARTGVSGHERLYEATRARLEDYAQRWSQSAVSACRATTIEHTESPLLRHRNHACLQTRLAELGQLTRSLAEANGALARRGPDLIATLAPIETCSDRDELLSTIDPPGDPVVQQRIVDLRGTIAEARVLTATAHEPDAHARMLPVVEEARRIGFKPLLGEALVELGKAEPRGTDGEARLVEAYDVALASRRFVTAARASEALVDVVGHILGRHKEGHVWARFGDAVLGDMASLEADDVRTTMLIEETYIYNEESDAAEAVASAERATAIAAKHHAPDDILTERLHVAMGVAMATKGDLTTARREFEFAVADGERRLGPDSSRVADRLSDLAATEINDTRYDLAVGHLDRALAIYATMPGEREQNVEVSLLNRSQALRRTGRCDLALQDAARGSAICARVLGPETEDMVIFDTAIADCERTLGHTVEATAAIDRAEGLAAKLTDPQAGILIEMRFAHAQILGPSDPHAVALARQARELQGAATTPGERERVAEMEQWLREANEGKKK